MPEVKPCPACNAPMAYGYAMARPPGCTKAVAVAAWRCVADGCGLGSFLGDDLTTTTGLTKFDFKARRRAPEGDDVGRKKDERYNENGWGGDRPQCAECGTTDRKHQSRGLCTACSQRKRKAAKKAAGGGTNTTVRGPKYAPRKTVPAARGTVELTIRVSREIGDALAVVAAYHETSPEELVVGLVERRFAKSEGR